MAVNTFFHTSNTATISTEKTLYSDLIAEAIQIYGHDVYYLDRTLVAEDTVLGEDSLSKFNTQAKIEMYIEDGAGGYAGEREMMSQFGLQNLSEVTFVVNKLRFQEITKQIQIEDGTDTSSSGSILLESGAIDTTAQPTAKFEDQSTYYILNETAATDEDRPLEGDAIWHPVLEKLFQINFVDHDDPFHQLDNNPIYKLHCRLFDYSSEALDTGITAIDAIEDAVDADALIYQFTLEQSSAVNEEIRLEWGIPAAGLALLDGTDIDFERIVLTGTDLHYKRILLSGTDSSSTNAGSFIQLEGAVSPAGDNSDGVLLNEDISEIATQNTGSNIKLESGISNGGTLLNEDSTTSTSNAGDNFIGENDSTSVGEKIILENGSYLINEDYIVGDADTDKTVQNELFDTLDDDVLDFSESNPFGDVS
tara:strand:- start:31 stop:1296 length:1266 start_codon:yes stop_codon:yes gene_type:complete